VFRDGLKRKRRSTIVYKSSTQRTHCLALLTATANVRNPGIQNKPNMNSEHNIDSICTIITDAGLPYGENDRADIKTVHSYDQN